MFKDRVYAVVKKIPKGRISTYKIVARKLKTKAYRAIGNVLAKNRDKEVPCHRVIKSNGELGGFRGKLNNKEKIRLLRKEGIKIKNNRIVDFEKLK